jgi:hypothetical protein
MLVIAKSSVRLTAMEVSLPSGRTKTFLQKYMLFDVSEFAKSSGRLTVSSFMVRITASP